uniref:Uncharacterized protein n=1 Tax=Chrysotila carterae TaxID=13221 RepID=A0A7S4B0E5_CHRCT
MPFRSAFLCRDKCCAPCRRIRSASIERAACVLRRRGIVACRYGAARSCTLECCGFVSQKLQRHECRTQVWAVRSRMLHTSHAESLPQRPAHVGSIRCDCRSQEAEANRLSQFELRASPVEATQEDWLRKAGFTPPETPSRQSWAKVLRMRGGWGLRTAPGYVSRYVARYVARPLGHEANGAGPTKSSGCFAGDVRCGLHSGSVAHGCVASATGPGCSVCVRSMHRAAASLLRAPPRRSCFTTRVSRVCCGLDDDAQGETARRGVGEVVKLLHGGKYQFGSGGAQASAGSAFAEALACSSSGGDAAADDGDVQPPAWARALRPDREASLSTLELASAHPATSVQVKNMYKTWEPFVAAVLPADDSASALQAAAEFELHPTAGTFAPRGGANNVCDPDKPYSDSQTLNVRWRGGEGGEAWLVIKTEESQWSYKLLAQG